MISITAPLRKSPQLYRAAVASRMRFLALLDLPRYVFCRLTRRVYFGPVMLGAQGWKCREPHMRSAIKSQLNYLGSEDLFRVLEIGSWAGQSAILWGSELTQSGRSGRIVCVDPWLPFATREQVGLNTATSIMDSVARRDRIFPLFWHNVRSAALTNVILPLRGRSHDLLQLLKPKSFDFVFVDGSHAYSDFTIDLLHAGPLVKDSGMFCGDDLELQFDEVDLPHAERNREKDFITDPKTGHDYHPGVCLGVAHYFKRRVSCRDGFWVVRRVGECWEDVQL